MKAVIVCLIFSIFLLFSPTAQAHFPGQESFFTVNGKYSLLYSVQSFSVPNFVLPQDIALDTYLVNQKIEFAIDTERLIMNSELVKKTTFSWDFGDGASSQNAKEAHMYAQRFIAFPFLRVVDENGFISDSFVELQGQAYAAAKNPLGNTDKMQNTPSRLGKTQVNSHM